MRAVAGGMLAASALFFALHVAGTAGPLAGVVVGACVFYTGGRIARPSAN